MPHDDKDGAFKYRMVLKFDGGEERVVEGEYPAGSVDPESEAANPVWDLVIQTCAQAWPAGLLTWNQSPTELIVKLINERDEARAALSSVAVYEMTATRVELTRRAQSIIGSMRSIYEVPESMIDELRRLDEAFHAPRSATAGFACEGEGLTMRCPSQCEPCAKKAAAALRLLRAFPGHAFEARYNGWLNERDALVGEYVPPSP